MKKGIDIGLAVIKCENKTGTGKIKDIHTSINAVIFNYSYKYISPADAEYIYTTLCQLGVQLKALDTPNSALMKKNEIIAKLRLNCQAINAYKQTVTLTSEDTQQVMATTKYYVSQYLNAKKENKLDDTTIINLLQEYKRINDNMVKPLGIVADSFAKIPAELITILNNKYND